MHFSVICTFNHYGECSPISGVDTGNLPGGFKQVGMHSNKKQKNRLCKKVYAGVYPDAGLQCQGLWSQCFIIFSAIFEIVRHSNLAQM